MRGYVSRPWITRICATCKKTFSLPDWFQYRKRTTCSKKCIPRTLVWRKRIAKAHLSQRNGMWKGDQASLQAIHIWISKRLPKPKKCVACKERPPKDLANISQKYLRDIKDYEWLCRSCHMKKDGRARPGYRKVRQRSS